MDTWNADSRHSEASELRSRKPIDAGQLSHGYETLRSPPRLLRPPHRLITWRFVARWFVAGVSAFRAAGWGGAAVVAAGRAGPRVGAECSRPTSSQLPSDPADGGEEREEEDEEPVGELNLRVTEINGSIAALGQHQGGTIYFASES